MKYQVVKVEVDADGMTIAVGQVVHETDSYDSAVEIAGEAEDRDIVRDGRLVSWVPGTRDEQSPNCVTCWSSSCDFCLLITEVI